MRLDMQLEANLFELEQNVKTYSLGAQLHIQDSMGRLGIESEADAKNTINTFVSSKGHKQGVNSGLFRDSVHSTPIEDGYGFRLNDGVPYGIYHEFGTQEHFVPFVDASGSLTALGKWAVLHFDDLGFSVIGTSGKKLKRPSRQSREDAVKSRGGMKVSLDEMAPFRKALEHAQNIAPDIFKEELAK